MSQTSFLDQCQPQWHLQDLDEAGETIILCDNDGKRIGPNQLLLI